jgi:acyl-CoA thioesterase
MSDEPQPDEKFYEAVIKREVESQFMRLLGVEAEIIAPGHSRLRLLVDERMLQPEQVTHGGVIFTLADSAAATALRSVTQPDERILAIEAKINFITAAREGFLVAEAKITSKGRTIAVCECDVYNDLPIAGQRPHLARLLGTYIIRSPKKD